ncbi:MAG: hypothetical protein K0Q50_2038 [Vampirovibrio sp.]|jgi:hypothetical protein|nr:hypothetical protein [Vampirovibrio sp.]
MILMILAMKQSELLANNLPMTILKYTCDG